VRQERPTFAEVEPPRVEVTPLDGLTDEEWAQRNERRGRVIRRVLGFFLGTAFGLFAGLLAVTRLNAGSRHYDLAVWLVMGGCLVAFVALFMSEEDHDLAKALGWAVFPENMLLDAVPWWGSLVLYLACVAVFVVVVVTITLGYLPWFS
jgi:hypothetical protein